MAFYDRFDIDWDLMARHFLKETDLFEESRIQRWASASDENRKAYEEIKTSWVETSMLDTMASEKSVLDGILNPEKTQRKSA